MKKRVAVSVTLFLATVAVFSPLFFHSPDLLEFDSYFHAKMGRLVLEKGLIHSFPWMYFTFQRDRYADPYLLFHIYLGLWIKLLPLSPIVAVKLAMLVLLDLIAVTFFSILKMFDPKWAWLGMALLAAMADSHVYQRLIFVRPHVLSILLLLLGLRAILAKKWWVLATVSFLYAYSYSAPHLLTVVALIASAIFSLTEKRLVWRPFVYSVGGLVAGLVANPYFPNDINFLYIVTFKMAAAKLPIVSPAELMPLSSWRLLTTNWSSFLLFALAVLAVFVSTRKPSSRSLFLFATAGFFFVLLMRSYRFIEYWPFVAALFVASIASEVVCPSPIFGRLMTKAGRLACAVAFLAVGAISFMVAYKQTNSMVRYASLKEVMDVLDREASPGDIVYTDNWAMTMPMFYVSDKVYYLLMSDPQTMYVTYPGLFTLWFAINTGGITENALPVIKAIEARATDPELAKLRAAVESGAVVGRLPDIIRSAFRAKWILISYNDPYAAQDLRPLMAGFRVDIQFVIGNEYFSLYRLR
jgi:hypothetical protein